MTKAAQYTINCFLDNDSGRDVEILLPIAIFAEQYLDCKVNFCFLWDLHSLKRDKPHLVLIPNTRGHHLYFHLSKICAQQGIPVFAHESEGNFRTDGNYEYWGYNLDHQFYQDWVCCWSERTLDFIKKLKPEQSSKIVFTGASGFDRYLFGQFTNKEKLLTKWNKQGYQKVIGYAGWAFGRIYGENSDTALIHIHPDKAERFKWVESQRQFVEGILESTIKQYPDILFILKRHPKEIFEHETQQVKNEMNGLTHYQNVLYLIDEEPIHDLIAISDIWMGFETTTSMEAWLLNKPTLLINQQTDFVRTPVYKGSAIAKDATALKSMINEYYQSGRISEFEKDNLLQERSKIITNSIGVADGFNHIRSAYYFKQSLDNIKLNERIQKVKIGAYFTLFYYFYHLFKYVYHRPLFAKIPKLKKTLFIFEKWALPDLKQRKESIRTYMGSFYKKKGILPVQSQEDSWWKRFFK